MKIKLLSLVFLLICSASIFADLVIGLYHVDITVTPAVGNKVEISSNFLYTSPAVIPVGIPGSGDCRLGIDAADKTVNFNLDTLTPASNGSKELTPKQILNVSLLLILDTDMVLLKTPDYTLSVKLTQPTKKKE
ncbi:MAG: hypothetical protein ABI443_12825 [Chthoniobacterales bacterium]